jgi:hypothetical protein
MSTTPTAANTGLSTWHNQNSNSVSDSAVGVCINASTTGAITGRTKASPGTPYTITALIAVTRNASGFAGAGIGWTDGTKLHVLSLVSDNGLESYLEVEKWTNDTTFSANDFTGQHSALQQFIWMRIRDDGTNVTFSYSNDGANFLTAFTVAKASGFLGSSGYSNVIFFANPQSAELVTLMSWTQGS